MKTPLFHFSVHARSVAVWGLALLLVAVVCALFAPAVSFSLVNFDDLVFITDNPIVADGFSWRSIPRAFSSLHADRCMYTPLLWISYLADNVLFGASPASPGGYHLANILFHAANTLLLFFILRISTRRTLPAFLAAVFWAIHPLRVESVAWVTERKDTLSTLFALSSILCYLKAFIPRAREGGLRGGDLEPLRPSPGTPKSETRFLALSFLFFLLGLLSKPMLVTLPFFFLLLDFWPLGRFSARALPRLVAEKWHFLLFSLVAAVSTKFLQAGATGSFPLLQRLVWLPTNYLFYFVKSFCPVALIPMNPGLPVSPAYVTASLLFLVGLALVSLLSLRRCPGFAVGIAAFAGMIFPVSGIVVIGQFPVADRYTYLPAIGLSLSVVSLLALLPRTKPHPALLCAAAAIPLGALGVATSRILPTWRNDEAFFSRVETFLPDYIPVLDHRFNQALFFDGDFSRAADIADRMAAQSPNDARVVLAQIRLLAQTVSSQAALDYYAAHTPCPNDRNCLYMTHCMLAAAAADVGEAETALAHLDEASREIASLSGWAEQFHALAVWVCLKIDRADLAVEHALQFPSAESAPPLAPESLLKPFATVWHLGLHEQALPSLLGLAREAPDNPALLNNIAWILATTPSSPVDPGIVLDLARQALELAPSQLILRDTFSVALAFAGRYDEAMIVDNAIAAALRASEQDADSALFLSNVEKHLDAYNRRVPYVEPATFRLLHSP